MLHSLPLLFFSSNAKSEEYQKSPFSDLDTLSTNDWWNRPENPIIDIKVERDNVIAFGIYTLSKNVLKLTAQLFPLYPDESRNIKFQIYESGKWNEIQKKRKLMKLVGLQLLKLKIGMTQKM